MISIVTRANNLMRVISENDKDGFIRIGSNFLNQLNKELIGLSVHEYEIISDIKGFHIGFYSDKICMELKKSEGGLKSFCYRTCKYRKDMSGYENLCSPLEVSLGTNKGFKLYLMNLYPKTLVSSF
jgi:hypothetical protein